jgi:hypothetical protein
MQRQSTTLPGGNKVCEEAYAPEPLWRNAKQVAAAFANIRTGFRAPPVLPPGELLGALTNRCDPSSRNFDILHRSDVLRALARASYRLIELNPNTPGFTLPPHYSPFRTNNRTEDFDTSPQTLELRHHACVKLVEYALTYLCAEHGWPSRPLEEIGADVKGSWRVPGLIGSRVWIMTLQCRRPGFEEEAEFILSIGMEFIDPKEKYENEIWVVSVCQTSAMLIRATMARPLIEVLEKNDVGKAHKPSRPDGSRGCGPARNTDWRWKKKELHS